MLPNWLNPEYIINALGNWALWGVALIVFAECGIFSVLPGDSLLFTVGMFVALGSITFGTLPTWAVLLICCAVLTIAAVLGNISGYWIGFKIGPALFKPRKGLAGKLFDPQYVEKTQGFYEKYGNRALILARFVPLVRTFVTLIAGIAKMRFAPFITFTAIGGVLWAFGVTLLGYFLGTVPFIHNNIEAVLIAIVFVSLIPMAIEYLNHRRTAKSEPSDPEEQSDATA
jgi:membrane-associated protein